MGVIPVEFFDIVASRDLTLMSEEEIASIVTNPEGVPASEEGDRSHREEIGKTERSDRSDGQ